MYLSHFGLTEKPFKISSDPKFLWLSDKHKEALAILKYGIRDNKGFLLLTGDVGTGKTTLINALINDLSNEAVVAVVSDPGLSKIEFYNFLANEFKIKEKFTDKATFLVYFRHFLNEVHAQKKKVLLIIDEAQRIDQDLLEDIRLLSNIEQQQIKLMNIFLIGQNDFNDTLLKIENRAIRQRISLNYHINPLLESETESYVKHRLKMAGCTKEIFDSGAIKEIFFYTKGFPRLINILCDDALLTGYVREQKIIGPDIIKECVDELRIKSTKMDYTPEYTSHRIENNSFIADLRKEAEDDEDQLRKHAEIVRKKYEKKAKSQASSRWGYISLIIFIVVFTVIFGFYVYHDPHAVNIAKIKAYFRDVHSNLQNKSLPFFEEKGMDTFKIPSSTIHENEPNDYGSDNRAIPVESIDKEKTITPTPIADTRSFIGENDGKINNSGKTITMPVKIEHPIEIERKKDYRELLNPEDREFYNMVISGAKILIQFDRNSNGLSKTAYNQIDIITEILKSLPETEIDIKGYSDSLGNETYNLNLSEFRANIVKSYFLGNGIDETRIHSTGMGDANPVRSNETMEGRKANRRVEIKVLFHQGKKGL